MLKRDEIEKKLQEVWNLHDHKYSNAEFWREGIRKAICDLIQKLIEESRPSDQHVYNALLKGCPALSQHQSNCIFDIISSLYNPKPAPMWCETEGSNKCERPWKWNPKWTDGMADDYNWCKLGGSLLIPDLINFCDSCGEPKPK